MALTDKLSAIGDAIRAKNGSTELLTLDEMPTAIANISGGDSNWNYDTFWDTFQENGTRTAYTYAFLKWKPDCFKPKYDLVLEGSGANAFQNLFDYVPGGASLKAILEECGVTLDTSGCTNISSMFRYARITELPTIDTTSTASIATTFANNSWLVTIEKLVLKDDGSQTFTQPFNGCTKLKNIVIEGVIGKDFPINSCPLTKDSITSVVNALSSTASGKEVLFQQTAKEAAFTDDEWSALIATKPNWTFSLV